MSELPSPMTPPDCDLRGMQWMPLDTVRVMDSDLFLTSTGDEFKAAFALWCKAWQQVPAGSLPNNEQALAALSQAKNWKKVRAAAMRGWTLCSDNRYYHQVVSEKALEALPARQEFVSKKSADALRKDRERADRKALFELLRENGVVPAYDTKTSQLRELAKPFVPPVVTPPHVTGSVTGGVTGHADVTAKTGTGTGNGEGQDHRSVAGATGGQPPKPPKTPEEMAKAELWRAGKSLLRDQQMPEAQCGTFVGKLCKDYGDEIVIEAVRNTVVKQPADAASYLKSECQRLAGERTTTKTTVRDSRASTLQGLTGDSTPGATHDTIDVQARRIA